MILPWEPLYTVERSGQPELTVYGIVSVLTGEGDTLLSLGNTRFPLWTRSLLKPWQLLTCLPALKEAYPALTSRHLALMISSHSGEAEQMEVLREIMAIGELPETALRCPACYPLSVEEQFKAKQRGETPMPLYHPCSGKHLALLMASKSILMQLKDAEDGLSSYLDKRLPSYNALRSIVAWILGKESARIEETTDECGMPNLALSAHEMALLFCGLAQDLTKEYAQMTSSVQSLPMLRYFTEVKTVMLDYPTLVGGSHRLDSGLMRGDFTSEPNIRLVAKEGADGLLGVGVSPCTAYPKGVGVLIKLSSGYEPAHLETLITKILEQLGLRPLSFPGITRESERVVKTRFHFKIPQSQGA